LGKIFAFPGEGVALFSICLESLEKILEKFFGNNIAVGTELFVYYGYLYRK
jgi:hypothetical protein